MQISFRSFPHPVLTPFSDDIIDCDFQCSLKTATEGQEYKFEAIAKVSNSKLNQLVKNSDAVFALHVECPATRHRTLFKFKGSGYSFSIPAERLGGRFHVCAFILADHDILYENPDFHPDYEGSSFSVRKGDILAVDETRTFYAERITDMLRQIPSIFTIARNSAQDPPAIDVDAQGDKIVILLSPQEYERYLHLRNDPALRPALNSMIVSPALTYILDLINPEHEANEPSDREDLRWYRVLSGKLKEHGINLESGNAFTDSSVKLASNLIGNPIVEGMETLIDISEEE
jgi:hypothetical protein